MKRFIVALIALLLSLVLWGPSQAQGVMYAVDRASDLLYKIDPATANATVVGNTGADVSFSGLSWSGSKMYACDLWTGSAWSLATINLNTGAATSIGPQGYANVMAIAHVGGTLYGFEFDAGLGTFNTTTGAFTPIPSTLPTHMYAADLDDSSGLLYTVGENSFLYTVNVNSGTATAVGSTGISFETVNSVKEIGLTYNAMDGQLYLLGNDVAGSGDRLYRINKSTGAATLIGSTPLIEADALEFVPIPEPSTLILLGIGAICLLGRKSASVCRYQGT